MESTRFNKKDFSLMTSKNRCYFINLKISQNFYLANYYNALANTVCCNNSNKNLI